MPPFPILEPNWGLHLPFIAAAREAGALITIDLHAQNPINLKQAQSHTGDGDEITAILPNGAANAMWTKWLDGIAQVAKADPDNAIIFRPFHEMFLVSRRSYWWAKGNNVT